MSCQKSLDNSSSCKDPDMFWDFLSLTPESIHQVTILFSDRGTPAAYRHMNGYSSHTYKRYNHRGEYFWVQYHFKTDQKIKNLTLEDSTRMSGGGPRSRYTGPVPCHRTGRLSELDA
ncbi:MAG: catalase [Syntrophales bacterium]|nr:catalase [Syntrophales bacterium]